jgi:hypothetical protein
MFMVLTVHHCHDYFTSTFQLGLQFSGGFLIGRQLLALLLDDRRRGFAGKVTAEIAEPLIGFLCAPPAPDAGAGVRGLRGEGPTFRPNSKFY